MLVMAMVMVMVGADGETAAQVLRVTLVCVAASGVRVRSLDTIAQLFI